LQNILSAALCETLCVLCDKRAIFNAETAEVFAEGRREKLKYWRVSTFCAKPPIGRIGPIV
jgi:hypothetical protein